MSEKVELLVTDSTAAECVPECYDFVFIDGDHTYQGVARDYHYWKYGVKPGGHLVFHDAVPGGDWPTYAPGVTRLVQAIETREGACWVRQQAAGSLAHLVRTAKSFASDDEVPVNDAIPTGHGR